MRPIASIYFFTLSRMATESKESDLSGRRPTGSIQPESDVPIEVIDARIRGIRLNAAAQLEASAFRHAVENALRVSAAKGFTSFGGLPHEHYREMMSRRISNESLFRVVCSLYADSLQQEISLHLLSADDGLAMWEAERKGSLLEYYNVYGSRPSGTK